MWTLTLAALAGLSFSVIGIAYRAGQSRRASPSQIFLTTAVLGFVFSLIRARGTDWAHLPQWVIGLALLSGITQCLTVRLLGAALRVGPLSPAWCAISLGFVPVTAYAMLCLDEPVAPLQYLAIALAALCVVIAAGSHRPADTTEARPTGWGGSLLYGLILVVLLLGNGVMDVAMKDLGTRTLAGQTYKASYSDAFMVLLYASLAVSVAIDLALTRGFKGPLRTSAVLGTIAAAGSIGGVRATTLCASGQAAMVFTVRGAVQLLAASTVSVLVFREALGKRWLATVGLAVGAVALAAPWGTPPKPSAPDAAQATSSSLTSTTLSAGQ